MSSVPTIIPSTMLAALYKPGDENLVMNKEYPVPKPGKNEVLIRVAGCGVCHTDTLWLSGTVLDPRHFVMGHEASGVPVQLGENVDPEKIKKGKLYSVYGATCASIQGGDSLATIPGLGKDGGFAEYMVASANNLVPVPDNVSVEEASVASDAGVTAYHAVHTAAGIQKGSQNKVLMFGIGGVGHLALQYAKLFGATVYACDIQPEARKLAVGLGAVKAFDLIQLDKEIKNGFAVDATIDFVANSQTFNLALAVLKNNATSFPPSGKAVLVGVSNDSLIFNSNSLIFAGIQVASSLYGSISDLEAALDLFSMGFVKARISTAPLEAVNKAMDDLRAFEVAGRTVIVPKHD